MKLACTVLVAAALGVAGCDEGGVDPTPENQNGVPSGEFEQDDIDAANNASEEVQEYCGGIESEAQRVGCLSHVDEDDIP